MNKMNSISPSLAIQSVRVLGEQGLVLDQDLFTSGINVIRGENSSGRTTFLKLIEYGLGANVSVSKFFIPEVQVCQRVLLEVLINGTIYTIERKIKWDSNRVSIYEGEIDGFLHSEPNILSLDELSDFFLYKLDIPRISYMNSYTGREKRVSFIDVINALYLDQETGFTEIHSRIRGEINRINIFKLLTNISNPDLFEIETEEESLKNEIKRLQQEYVAVTQFLGRIELPTNGEIQAQIETLIRQKDELGNQLRNVKQNLRATPGYISPLRDEILVLEDQVSEKCRELNNTNQNLRAYGELENQLYDDLDKLARVRISAQQLSTYEFDKCPRCLQPITVDMQRLEAEGQCSLCGRPVIKDPESVENFEVYEKQINAQINELHELQSYYITTTNQLTQQIKKMEKSVDEKKALFDETIKEYTSPLLNEVEDLGSRYASIVEQISRLEELGNWRKHLEMMQEKLNEQVAKFEILQSKKESLQESENAMKYAISNFEIFFIDFIRDIYPGFREAIINREDFLPEINKVNYRVKSSTQQDITILGYFYALLKFSLEYSSHIPRFLMIDTPRQDDLANDIYLKVLEKYKELESTYPKAFQLILVITEPCKFLRKNEKLQLINGSKLLALP